jgi:pseudaminic acid biosynthesis-associated methylase
VPTPTAPANDTERIEQLWAGEFGNAYLHRNISAAEGRAPFWDGIAERFAFGSVLEVGCTQGDNLIHLARHVPADEIWGVDINPVVLDHLRGHVPGVNPVLGVARDLPFPDDSFDLVVTVGLLIHIPDDTLERVMAELVRVSRRWILSGEYHADEQTEIVYRGHEHVLFKRDYGTLYRQFHPELRLAEDRFLTKDDGFDRVTYQVFEKP